MSNVAETEIRAVVRELLLEIVPQHVLAAAAGPRQVEVSTEADLTAFATLILDLARDPAAERDIRSGRLRFEPAPETAERESQRGTAAQTPALQVPAVKAVAPELRIDKGAVTEKVIARAAATGTRLVLGRRAVVTPLAKEAARKNGVRIERTS